MIEIWKAAIPQLTGKEKRKVYVCLPEGYEENTEKRYPVLYMFDGHNLFDDEEATYGKSWGLADYMKKTGRQLIIVGVECNHSPDHGRLKEYSPYDFYWNDVGLITGRGRETMQWFTGWLKRTVDRRYRTLPDRTHTFIAGSSMGGLMSLYAFLEYGHIYKGAAALSPSIWCCPLELRELIRRRHPKKDAILYMDYGQNEFANHENMKAAYMRCLQALLKKGVNVTSRIVPEGWHCEASWEKQIPYFMDAIFYDMLDEIEASKEKEEEKGL